MARQRNPYDSTEGDIWNPGDLGAGDLVPTAPPVPPQGPVQDFPTPQGPIVPAGGGGYSGPLPPGVSQAEFEDALRRNPGDEARLLASGFPSKPQPQVQQRPYEEMAQYQGPQPNQNADLMNTLKGLFPGGAFNQDVVNRRTELAREDLGRQQKSRTASNRAALANRGLIGSGPEITAANRTEESIADQYSNAVSGIYADESQNADNRMMQALGLASSLNANDAQNAIDWFRANTDRSLGFGQLDLNRTLGTGRLALDNSNAANNYNLDLGRLGLDRDRLLAEIENGNIDQLIELIQLYLGGAANSSGGYV